MTARLFLIITGTFGLFVVFHQDGCTLASQVLAR